MFIISTCRSKFLDICGGEMGPDAEEVVNGIFKVESGLSVAHG